MSWRAAGCLLIAVSLFAGCESKAAEVEKEGEHANAPAAKTVRSFYAAANRSAGEEACALLTEQGMRQIVHASSRTACVRTIHGLSPGGFSSKKGDLLHIEGVDEHGENAFDVDARLTGRSGGTYGVVERNGKLLIDAFESDEC
jgi:hypothetical protein